MLSLRSNGAVDIKEGTWLWNVVLAWEFAFESMRKTGVCARARVRVRVCVCVCALVLCVCVCVSVLARACVHACT